MKKFALVALSIFTLAGCTEKAPSCSDPQTLSLIRQIMIDNTASEQIKSQMTPDIAETLIKFSNARALGYDKEVNIYHCNAHMEVSNQISYDLTYDSQRLEDGSSYAVVTSQLLGGDRFQIGRAIYLGFDELMTKLGATKADGVE